MNTLIIYGIVFIVGGLFLLIVGCSEEKPKQAKEFTLSTDHLMLRETGEGPLVVSEHHPITTLRFRTMDTTELSFKPMTGAHRKSVFVYFEQDSTLVVLFKGKKYKIAEEGLYEVL